VHLAHHLRTRAIGAARVKTDAIDAKTLAHLLRTGILPEAYVAPRELRDLRGLLRHRATLTRMRSAVKNRVHAILAKHGIANEHSDLFGKGGREFLASLELRAAPRRPLDSLMALIRDFDRERDHTTHQLEQGLLFEKPVTLIGAGADVTRLVASRVLPGTKRIHGQADFVLCYFGSGRLGLRDLAFQWTGDNPAIAADVVVCFSGEMLIERCRFSGSSSRGVFAAPFCCGEMM